MLHVVACALGSRGDVQPVALLTWQLAHQISTHLCPQSPESSSSSNCVQITLITHAAHTVWLDQLQLEFVDASVGRQLKFLFISTLPAAVWHTESRDSQCAANSNSEDVTRAEMLQHCCTALNLPWPGAAAAAAAPTAPSPSVAAVTLHQHAPQPCPSYTSEPQQQQQQEQQQQQQQQQQVQRLLLFNLFALEGYSIAEALQVPCCVVQPYLVPYSMPAGFKRRFQQAAPGLAARLQAAEDVAAAAAAGLVGGNCGAPCVSWKDVSHWMWPLFTERWGAWRQEVLGLHPWPLVQAVQEGWQGCTFAIAGAAAAAAAAAGTVGQCSHLASSAHAAAAAAAGGGERAEGACHMPGAVPVLYGLSLAVVQQPGYWPQAVRMCGFWLSKQLHKQQQQQNQQRQQLQQRADVVASRVVEQKTMCRLPEALQDFLRAHGKTLQQQQQQMRLLVVDFGSMGAIGLLRDAHTLVQVLLGTLQLLGPEWSCVLLTGGWQPLLEAYQTRLSRCHINSHSQMPLPQEEGTLVCQQQQEQEGSHGQVEQQPTEGQQAQPASLTNMFVQHESLGCHHLLLEVADVLLHHGGSGTTAAALAAGVPQLVCPLQFDQHYWAERMADLGCAPSPIAVDKLIPAARSAASTLQSAAGHADTPTTGPETAAAQPVHEAAVAIAVAGSTTAVDAATPVHDCLLTQEAAAAPKPRCPIQGSAAAAAATDVAVSASAAAAAPAPNVAVQAAEAYLAAQVLAAREPAVLQACTGLRSELEGEDGLVAAVSFVQEYLQRLYCSSSSSCGQ